MLLVGVPAYAYASDPSGLIPYLIGYMVLVGVIVYFFVWLATKSLENGWHRFYIRVLSVPTAFTLLMFSMGTGLISIIPFVIAVAYIVLYRGFTSWLRR